MGNSVASPSPHEPHRTGGTWSELSGHARDVVQARDVMGGIHFHTATAAPAIVPRELPGNVRGFVGRTADLDLMDSVLERSGESTETVLIASIVGTAGVGKTSLAVHWAHRVKDQFPDGQLYVNLRGYDAGSPVTADQALQRFLRILDVDPGAIPDDTEDKAALYRSILSNRRVLVLLDNASKVGQVRPLLPGTASCMVVVTSRIDLPGLVVRDGARRINLDVLSTDDAVGLLRRAMVPHRGPDSDEALAELAHLCAYLPLALRIAAERAAARPRMPLDALIQDLKDESRVWRALSADEDGVDAVHTVFSWSYRALPEDTARLFRLLGLHPGQEISLLAAAALADVPVEKARQLVESLIGAHLLSETSYDRYQFHDLLRAYAGEQARQTETPEELHAATARLCRWYVKAMAAAALPHDTFYADDWAVIPPPTDTTGLPTFANFDQAMIWFIAETDNLVAVSTLAAEAGLDDVAWVLPALIRTPYMDRQSIRGWLPLAESALRATRRSGDRRGESITLMGFSIAYRDLHRVPEAVEYSQAALVAAEDVGDPRQEAASLTMLGHAQRRGRRLDEAIESYHRALALANANDLPLWTVWPAIGLAEALLDAGRLDEAYAEITGLLGRIPPESPGVRTEGLWVLAGVERELGALADARTHIQEALSVAYETKNTMYQGRCELEMGRLLIDSGRLEDSLESLQHAAAVGRRLGDGSVEACALDDTGRVYRELGRLEEAVHFHRLAVAAHRELDDVWRLAAAVNNMAITTAALGDRVAARQQWSDAADLVVEFDDPRAAALRAEIAERLAG
ncbi:ATP-binding protein [Dactylosporangium sp. CS-047395]|uniref:ATP-binding protein n=1 Tax=Dactylosporangium sp. CS-047395 TaxID=3239936 RepID=UPI003D8EE0E3